MRPRSTISSIPVKVYLMHVKSRSSGSAVLTRGSLSRWPDCPVPKFLSSEISQSTSILLSMNGTLRPQLPSGRLSSDAINVRPSQLMLSISQFHLTDNNAGSVLTYGLTGIKNDPITEIHIVGHSDCGGVNACHAA